MKIIKLTALFMISLIATSGIVMAQGENTKDTTSRYLIMSGNVILKAAYGVEHQFDRGFTTDLSQGQLKQLQRLGIETEQVPEYHISGKPVCGDGICQGKETQTCPDDCSSNPAPDPVRTCEPATRTPWGITEVNGGSGGSGITVAVLDTGANTNHPDLNIAVCKDTTKRGIKNGCSDGNGHGTHVAGTIAANGGNDNLGIIGVAPEARLMIIKVLGNSGLGWSDDIAAGIRYASDNGANIISMSLGGDTESSLIRDAIVYATSKGVLVVAAAGNDGPADGSIDYPGANANTIAVGAIDSSENVPSWSSRGIDDGDDSTIIEKEIEVAAPGVSVLSTYNDGCYRTLSGTSMATPHVSGLAAKLWQGTATATRTYLQILAKDHDIMSAGYDTATGYGLPIAP